MRNKANNKPNILKTDVQKLKHIIHISDVHIRKRERHKEYQIVFDRLYEEIKAIVESSDELDVVVAITGDTVHDKTELVPESIDVLRRFLISISNMTEILLLVGNHDVNIFNVGSLDSLSPIVTDLRTKHKIHLLNEDKVYLYGETGVAFGITTIWGNKVTDISQYELDDDIVKVALYHGMIHGCTLDNGMLALNDARTTNSSYFNVGDFDAYDLTLLGDVHKHQFLNADRTMAYAGSLIQQKRDEDLLEHGYILWDVQNLNGEFKQINSDYGMVQIKIPDNTVEFMKMMIADQQSERKRIKCRWNKKYPNSKLPPNIDVKLIYSSIQARESFKKIYELLSSEIHITKSSEMISKSSFSSSTINAGALGDTIEFGSNSKKVKVSKAKKLNEVEEPNGMDNEAKNTSDDKSNGLIKITGNDSVVRVIMNHYDQTVENENGGTDINTRNLVRKEVVQLLNDINYNYEKDVKNIKLKSIEFDNMFIYLKGNEVDFALFDDIVGLNAGNYKGKSSFIDVILYSIYGKCSRGKRFDILNLNRTKMMSRIVLDVNGIEYIILRDSYVNSVKNRDLKESVKFFENKKEITADDRVKTHKLIESKICSYSDMINNSFVLQKNGTSFTDLTDRQKKDLLCKMARLDVFDRVFHEAKSKHFSLSQSYGKNIRRLEPLMQIYLTVDEIESLQTKRSDNNIERKLALVHTAIMKGITSKTNVIQKVERNIQRIRKDLTDLVQQESALQTEEIYGDQIIRTVKQYDTITENISDISSKVMHSIFEYKNLCNQRDSLLAGSSLVEYVKKSDELLNDTQHKISSDRDLLLKLHTQLMEDDRTESDILQELSENREQLIDLQDRIIAFNQDVSDVQSKIDNMNKMMERDNLVLERIKSIRQLEEDVVDLNSNIHKQKGIMVDCETTLDKLSNHEYNLDCEKCMLNPVTKNIMHYQSELNKAHNRISQDNSHILIKQKEIRKVNVLRYEGKKYICEKEYDAASNRPDEIINMERTIKELHDRVRIDSSDIDIIRNKIERIEKEHEQYRLNVNIKDQISKVVARIKAIEDNDEHNILRELISKIKDNNVRIKGVADTIDRYNKRIVSLHEDLDEYADVDITELRIKLIERSSLSDRLELTRSKITRLNKLLKTKITKSKSLVNAKTTFELDLARYNDIKTSIDDDSNSRLVLAQIKKILDRSGLVDSILSKIIIPYLQVRINNILSDVGHYQINISYRNQSVNIYKDNGLNICMSSGYESYLLDLVFRLALVQVNNHIRTDFLVIDEGFSACDADHKNNIRQLLEYMRTYYSWLLVISHDDFIKSFYDQEIKIETITKLEKPYNKVIDGSLITNVQKKKDIDRTVDRSHMDVEHNMVLKKKVRNNGNKRNIKKIKNTRAVKNKN
jgi:DNA repair exonuclease SbcCD ATPase subunit